MFAPNRAVSFGDNPEGETNFAAVLGFLPAFIFAAVSMVAFYMLASYAFRSARDEEPVGGEEPATATPLAGAGASGEG